MFYVTCNTCKEFWLTCKSRDSRQISSFSKKFGEIPTKFHQNLTSKWQNSIKKGWKLNTSVFILEKMIDDFLVKFWSLSGAKVCESCRSRHELSNEYLLAKIGVDTAENEPPKVWRKIHFIYSIFTKIMTTFCWNFEIWAVQKNANPVDLEECRKMRLCSLS